MSTKATSPAPSRKGEETRSRVLSVAAELVRQQGYTNTGIQEILDASGVPKGSFYFHFKSKEELGRALIQREWVVQRDHLQRNAFPPEGAVLPQFEGFFREAARGWAGEGCRGGCLFGNLANEISDVHEGLRQEVAACFGDLKGLFAEALARGQRTGELKSDFEPEAAAAFLVAVLEGSILLAKAQREPASLDQCTTMVTRFLHTLATPAPTGARNGIRNGGRR